MNKISPKRAIHFSIGQGSMKKNDEINKPCKGAILYPGV
jgi:hypothetical protein